MLVSFIFVCQHYLRSDSAVLGAGIQGELSERAYTVKEAIPQTYFTQFHMRIPHAKRTKMKIWMGK